MTLMGLCSKVSKVRASELLDYTDYEGDYDFEMGIGKLPEYRPLFENRDILIMAWGATVPMIAHAAGIMLDEITTTWDKWVTPNERKTAKGVIAPGNVAAVRFTINGVYKGETRIQLEHVNRIGSDAAPDWPSGNENDVYRVDIEGTPSIHQETAFRFTDGPGATRPPQAASRPVCAPSMRCPPSTSFPRMGHRAGSTTDSRGGDYPLSNANALNPD